MKPNPFEILPDAVEVNGVLTPVCSDFRMGVAIENEMLSGEPDIAGLLAAFYPDGIPQDVEAAAERMLWFYAHTSGQDAENEDGETGGSAARLYDFAQDADALTASFQQAYGIALERDRLHWWKFRHLMFGLPQDTPFMQRVHYRAADIKKLPKEQRKHYRRMKRLYALKQPEKKHKVSAAEREAAMKERVQRRFEEAKHASKN